jgi:feruloyl esterase
MSTGRENASIAKRRIAILMVAALGSTLDANAQDDATAACAKLTDLEISGATVTLAHQTPAGTFNPRALSPAAASAANATAPQASGPQLKVPEFCRVAATLKPSRDSQIRIEVWLPSAASWNGRFQGVGNGGLAGSIMYAPLAEAVSAGYATASTDTGHTGSASSGEWALGHPEKVVDFGYRAIHEMTVAAKIVVDAYYGRRARFSYWNGCSEGGNQALGSVQRFAQDYDGVLAGAPANYMTRLQTAGNWISHAIHKDPATFVPADKLPALNRAVLAACDAKDGVADGVLNDPRACDFDIAQLRCAAGDSAECLSDAQIQGLRKVYAGPRDARTGKQLFPGHMLGSELDWATWIAGAATPPNNLQHLVQDGFFKYLVFEDPKWDWRTFDFGKDVELADRKIGHAVNQIAPDLSAFRKRGGKLIQYHGWYDPAIAPGNSIDYFESVRGKLGDTSDFYRLFMIPGMNHCRGGPGAVDFDKMAVITRWVEEGVAPDAIVAASIKRDFTRPLCSYPKTAKYQGGGDTTDAANFICAAP